MTTQQKVFCDEVNNIVSNMDSVPFCAPLPFIDLALAHDMGFTPNETALAITGKSYKVMEMIVDESRRRGEISPEGSVHGKETSNT